MSANGLTVPIVGEIWQNPDATPNRRLTLPGSVGLSALFW